MHRADGERRMDQNSSLWMISRHFKDIPMRHRRKRSMGSAKNLSHCKDHRSIQLVVASILICLAVLPPVLLVNGFVILQG